ncbi:MAG: hypothetical protein GDA54_06170 [Alphaproteobacteria bacterium GM7ARS4]|nr:hypothetical protein [Alphaproteobacteria bacterium GM7ARS4]
MKTSEQELDDEIAYVNQHQKELLKTYKGKVIVVKNHEVVKACDSFNDAAIFAMEKYGDGVYLIREMTEIAPKLPSSYLYGI